MSAASVKAIAIPATVPLMPQMIGWGRLRISLTVLVAVSTTGTLVANAWNGRSTAAWSERGPRSIAALTPSISKR